MREPATHSGARLREGGAPAARGMHDRPPGADLEREGGRRGRAPGPAHQHLALAHDARRPRDGDRAPRAAGGEREHARHVHRAHAPARPALEPAPHDAARERRRLLGHRRAEMLAGDQLARTPGRRRGEEVVLVAQALRERGQRRPEARVELGAQQRDEEPAHTIARVAQVGVRAIDREAEATFGEEAAHVGARRGEQRAPEPAAHRAHGTEAAPPRAPSSRARRRPRPAGARPPPGRRARRAPPPAGARARASRRGGARAQPRLYGLPSGTPTMPMRIAYSASAVRPRSPSFWKMLFRCVFTVTSLIERRSATSALRSPMATWRTISISRGVSGSSGGSVRRAVRCLWSAGGIHTLPSTTAAMASISVSIAKRLKTTARAPERRAARASSARSLAVTTITVTRSARALMSTKALRSICRSSSRMSQGVAATMAAS